MSQRPRDGGDTPAARLVLTSSEGGGDACADLLESTPPPELDVLFVDLSGTADDCLDRWRSNVALTLPSNIGIVCADESQSASSSTPIQLAAGGRVRFISSPGDLTGLGIAISEFLAEWHGNANRTVACFDSVTTLLHYADTQRVFQFLHVLVRRFTETDATVSFRMDPRAHDDRTVRTITSLFDHVVGEEQ